MQSMKAERQAAAPPTNADSGPRLARLRANRLLAALPRSDQALLEPFLEEVN